MLEASELVERKENSIKKMSNGFSLKGESSRSILKRGKEPLVKE